MAGYYPVFPVPVSNSLSSSSGRQRHFYTETQLELLDAEFAAEQFPSRERRRRIAQQLNVTEKSVLWWFQNRRRRIRQQTKTLNSAGARNHRVGRSRQHRRSSPYAAGQLQRPQDLGENWTSVSTSWPVWAPAGPFPATNNLQTPEEPTNYSPAESTSPSYHQDSSPSPVDDQTFQPHWISPSYSVNQNVVEMQPNQFYNYGYPSGFQADEQHNSYWTNWEYSPPFYPSTVPNSWSTNSTYYFPTESSDFCSAHY